MADHFASAIASKWSVSVTPHALSARHTSLLAQGPQAWVAVNDDLQLVCARLNQQYRPSKVQEDKISTCLQNVYENSSPYATFMQQVLIGRMAHQCWIYAREQCGMSTYCCSGKARQPSLDQGHLPTPPRDSPSSSLSPSPSLDRKSSTSSEDSLRSIATDRFDDSVPSLASLHGQFTQLLTIGIPLDVMLDPPFLSQSGVWLANLHLSYTMAVADIISTYSTERLDLAIRLYPTVITIASRIGGDDATAATNLPKTLFFSTDIIAQKLMMVTKRVVDGVCVKLEQKEGSRSSATPNSPVMSNFVSPESLDRVHRPDPCSVSHLGEVEDGPMRVQQRQTVGLIAPRSFGTTVGMHLVRTGGKPRENMLVERIRLARPLRQESRPYDSVRYGKSAALIVGPTCDPIRTAVATAYTYQQPPCSRSKKFAVPPNPILEWMATLPRAGNEQWRAANVGGGVGVPLCMATSRYAGSTLL